MNKTYLVIGECAKTGEKVLFTGSKAECTEWIWNNCDIGDLYNRCGGRWSGIAYYDTENVCYSIEVDKFYK